MSLYRVQIQKTATGWVVVDSDDVSVEPGILVDEVAAYAVRAVEDGDLIPSWEWTSAEWLDAERLP